MPTTREIITAVREYCGNPDWAKLNAGTICLHLYDQIDHLLTRLNLTDENWILGRSIIPVYPGTDEYPLPPNFGRAMFVETVDDGSTDFVRREVQIVNAQDIDLFWQGVKDTTGGSYPHNSSICCFFGLENTPIKQIKFSPPPAQAVSYRVWYELNRQLPPALAAKPAVMEQFHNLLKVNTALMCLPHCGYDVDNYGQRQGALQMFKAEFDDVYERYISQNHHEDTGPRRSFNSSRRGNSGGGGWW